MKYFLVLTTVVSLLFSFQGSLSAEECNHEIPLTKSEFEQMLLHRNDDRCPAHGYYTYDDFIAAAKDFPGFGTTGDEATRKREIAAFFGQTSHETRGGWPTAPGGPYAWGYCFFINFVEDKTFKDALEYWMTPRPVSCHDVITGKWTPNEDDINANRKPGYGLVTNIFNAGQCGWGPNDDGRSRIGFYDRFCSILGVDKGENLDCYHQRPFTGLRLNTV